MSDTDLQTEAEAVETTEEPGYPGDTDLVETEEVTEEGTIGETTEEAAEEGTEDASSEEAAPDWFSTLTEEQQEAATRFAHERGEKRVSDLTSSWQQKLDEAAVHRKTVEDFDQRLKNDPAGLMADIQAMIPEKTAEPEGPGEMPDVISDPEGFSAWLDAKVNTAKEVGRKEVEERLAPAMTLAQQVQVAERRRTVQTTLEAGDTEMDEITALQGEIQKSPETGWKVLQEVVQLRKIVAGKVEKKKADLKEAQEGSEERPGLPRTGATRQRPTPTGDPTKDAIEELKFQGHSYPGDG